MKQVKNTALKACVGVCAFLVCSLLGMSSPSAYLAGILIAFGIAGYLFSKKSNTFISNLQGSWGLILPVILFWTNPLWLEDTFITFPIWGPSPIVGWVFGAWLKSGIKTRKGYLSLSYSALFISIVAFASLWLQPSWIVFASNARLSPAPQSITSLRVSMPESGQEVSLTSFADKVQVFNFWSYSCGACIEEFPWWEKAKQAYANDSTVKFNLVRWSSDPREDSLAQASHWRPEKQTTLSTYVISDAAARSMGVAMVPHVWIVDAQGNTIFWGFLPYWESGFKRKLEHILKNQS